MPDGLVIGAVVFSGIYLGVGYFVAFMEIVTSYDKYQDAPEYRSAQARDAVRVAYRRLPIAPFVYTLLIAGSLLSWCRGVQAAASTVPDTGRRETRGDGPPLPKRPLPPQRG